MTISQEIAKIQAKLIEALKDCDKSPNDNNDLNDLPDISLVQDVRLPEQVIRKGGNVIVLGKQTVNINIRQNIIEALEIAIEVQDKLRPAPEISGSLQLLMQICLDQGLTLQQFKDQMASHYIEFAESVSKTRTKAAKLLDVSRGTINYHKDKNPHNNE